MSHPGSRAPAWSAHPVPGWERRALSGSLPIEFAAINTTPVVSHDKSVRPSCSALGAPPRGVFAGAMTRSGVTLGYIVTSRAGYCAQRGTCEPCTRGVYLSALECCKRAPAHRSRPSKPVEHGEDDGGEHSTTDGTSLRWPSKSGRSADRRWQSRAGQGRDGTTGRAGTLAPPGPGPRAVRRRPRCLGAAPAAPHTAAG